MLIAWWIPAAITAASTIGSMFAGRGDDRRARRLEDMMMQRYGQVYRDPLGRAQQLSQKAVSAYTEQNRPEFERGLRESVGDVVGGLGRRGGLVQRTATEAGERFAESTANFAAQQVPSMLNYALGRENMYLDMLAGVHDVTQGRANAARRGWQGLAGMGLQMSMLRGGGG